MQGKKILIRRPGGYERLESVAFELAEIGPTEVLVETESIGVNFADVVVRIGLYPSAKKYVGWPITPGFEFAGRVSRVGRDVTRVAVGDSVVGVTRFGAYSSHVAVEEDYIFRLPRALDADVAGGVPVSFLTAHYALHQLGAVQAGQSVLIHSAAGAVGSSLVQLAKLAGARVIAVVGSKEKLESVRALGADVVLDKSEGRLWETVAAAAPQGIHIALDANGYETLSGSYRSLRPTGRLVIYGAHSMLSRGRARPNWLKLAFTFLRTPRFHPLNLTNDNKAVLGFNLSYLFEEKDMLTQAMGTLLEHFAEGRLQPLATQRLALDDAPKAHALLQSGTTIGKIVLAP